MSIFTIGNDVEVFFQNKDRKLITCIGKVGGTKDQPRRISEEGHAVLEDNVAAEMNVPPASNLSDFKRHVHHMLSYLKEVAAQYDCQLATSVASGSFDFDQLEDPMSWVFGCDPDHNAWRNGEQNPAPHNPDATFRSCGGHIHIGTDKDPVLITRRMDLFAAIPALFMDKDTKRRSLYGKGGCFRYKPYGLEYRTLSNFWVWDDRLIDWAFEQTQRAVESDLSLDDIDPEIESVINMGDLDRAKEYVNKFNLCVI